MIEIFENTFKGPRNVYSITHSWILGKHDGDMTTYQKNISKDNSHLEKFLECCDRLKTPMEGHIGNILDTSTMKKCLGDDYIFFRNFLEYEDNRLIKDIEYSDETEELFFEVITEKSNVFVMYGGFKIAFYDENGIKKSCKWTKNE